MQTNLALKEWAVVVAALDRGEQVMLLRKGGIAEKGFDVKSTSFVFYPTYYHEMQKHVESKYHPLLESVADYVKEETVIISNWAIVDEIIITKDLDSLLGVSDHYIYNPYYVKERFDWRADAPMNILFVRVHKLPETVKIAVKSRYRGCKSWVELEEAISLDGSTPVLEEKEFQTRKEVINSHLYASKMA